MSDLSLGPPPSSNPTRAIVAATVVLLLLAAGVFYWMHQQKAELTVVSSKPYAVHIQNKAMKGGSVHVIGTPASVENDLYIVLVVRLTNHLHEPLFVKDATFTLTSPDQTVAASDALQKQELDSVLLNFPDMKPLVGTPLYRDTKIEPGQTAEGTLVVHYPTVTEEFWTKRSDGKLTVSFFHQADLTAAVPAK